MHSQPADTPGPGDALIIVDVQNDFLPGGALGVADGDAIIPVLNRYIAMFASRKLPVFATRDWHPANHCSFQARGGPWPPHCIADTPGAEFGARLELPDDVRVVSKATNPDEDAYSGFEQTDLAQVLRGLAVRRVFVGGLATDYCVLNTVKDALSLGFEVLLIRSAVRAVELQAGDGERALRAMQQRGAQLVD